MQVRRLLLFGLFCLLFGLGLSAQSYKRIVSLAPSLTQGIYYLEASGQLIGCTSYCKEAIREGKTVVATAVKPNIEKVIALKPDLVLAANFTSPEDIALLKKFGIRVERFTNPKSYQEICQQFLEVGRLLGKEEKAKAIVKESQQEVQTVSEKLRQTPYSGAKIFFQIGANPIYAVLPNTFMDDYIGLSGGKNIASKLKKGAVGREFVLAQSPDYIFVVTMGIVGEEEVKAWQRNKQLEATKRGQIYILDSEIACQPSPITFAKTMQAILKHVNEKR